MADNETTTSFIGTSEILLVTTAVDLSSGNAPDKILIVTKDASYHAQKFLINPLGINGAFTKCE